MTDLLGLCVATGTLVGYGVLIRKTLYLPDYTILTKQTLIIDALIAKTLFYSIKYKRNMIIPSLVFCGWLVDKYLLGNFTIIQTNGWALAFHPDFISSTSLGNQMHLYHFFGYHIHEALHLSKREIKLILNCFKKIKYELNSTFDTHTKTLICGNIELLLNYCNRFYSRQFITRELINKNVINQLDQILYLYFESDEPQEIGLPSVSYCADKFHLSPNYFGDLIKKESGRSAQEYIQQKIIDIAKHRLSTSNKSISEIAYELGFKYPQHFTKLFKLKTSQVPSDYRKENS